MEKNQNTQQIATIIATVAETDTSLISKTGSFGFKSADLERVSIAINNLIAEVNGVADNNTKQIAKLVTEVDSHKDWLEADGFSKTTDWTYATFGYNPSTTSKLIRVYKIFLETDKQIGNAPASDYTVGQLQELLTAKPEHLEALKDLLSPDCSAKTIRALLKEIKNPSVVDNTKTVKTDKTDNGVVDNKTTDNSKTEKTDNKTNDNKTEKTDTVETEIVPNDFITDLKLKLAQLGQYTDNAEALELAQRLIEII